MEWYDYRGFDSAIREVGDGFSRRDIPGAVGIQDLLKAIEYNAKFLPVIGMFSGTAPTYGDALVRGGAVSRKKIPLSGSADALSPEYSGMYSLAV